MKNPLYTLRTGQVIENYKIQRVLGVGGFGITYQAHDLNLDVSVAIKEYFPHGLAIRETDGIRVSEKSQKDKNTYEYGLQRFMDEARTLALFKNQSIVRVSRYVEKHGTAYIIMDYEEGVPLSRYLMRCKTLNEIEIKNVFKPIFRGLNLVHSKDYLHRDVKPSNIYLRKKGPPVLLDFGAARQALNQRERNITNLGTHGYAPIEQFSTQEPQGPWTDIYGVGATIYHCMTGAAPIPALDRVSVLHAGRKDPLPPLSQLRSKTLSAEFLECVDWMLSVQSRDRPRNINEVLPIFSRNISEPQTILTEKDVDWDAELIAQVEQHLARHLGPLAQTIIKQSMNESTNIEDLYRILGTFIDSTTERDLFLRSVQATSSRTDTEQHNHLNATQEISEAKTQAFSQIDVQTEQSLEKHLAAQIGPLAGMLVKQALQACPDIAAVIDRLCNELPTEEQKETFRKKFTI